MAEQEKIVEHIIDNVGVPTWQTGLARAVNDTYSYADNSMFYGLVSNYMRPYYYRYVRPCLQWLDGFVPSLHSQGTSGIISTRIGKSLIGGLTKQIVGEKLILKLNEEETNDTLVQNFKEINKWSIDNKIISKVFTAVAWALGSGTSFLKINRSIDGELWWDAVRIDKCFYRTNFKGEIQEATFLIRDYVDNKDNKNQYFLVEKRFYKTYDKAEINKDTLEVIHAKGEVVPTVVYQVKMVRGTINNDVVSANVESTRDNVNWDELPKRIRDAIREDFAVIRIGEEQPLGLSNLGVEVLLNSYQDIGIPNGANLGEGLLLNVQSELITYEIAASYKIRDMYLGKGSVYQPKSLSMGDFANGGAIGFNEGVLQGIGEGKVELLKGLDPETQKVIVEQFQLRANEWQTIMDDCIKNIAKSWSMSPKVLSSYLANSVQMTATQVDSEDDMSIAFIYHTRSYFVESINRLLETTMNAKGISANITVGFASPSLINKDRIIERQAKLLDAGLTSIEDAIREIYPDLEEEQIQRKVKQATENRKNISFDALTEMNDDGTFGNV